MRSPFLTFAVLLALAALPGAAQEWAGSGRVEGTVTSADGRPLEGAAVTLQLLGDRQVQPPPLLTDGRGSFALVGLRAGDWVVRADAEGQYPDLVLAAVPATGIAPPVGIVLQPVAYDERDTRASFKANQYLRQGDGLAAEGHLEEARERYEKARAELAPPDQGGVLAAIAITYIQQGDLERAEKLLTRALEVDPSQQRSLDTLAAIMADRGQATEAEKVLRILGSETPVSSTTLVGVAVANYNQGRPEAAKPLLDRAIEQDPGASEPYYFRGLVDLSLGDTAAARSDLEAYLKREPDGRFAADATQYLGVLEADGGEK